MFYGCREENIQNITCDFDWIIIALTEQADSINSKIALLSFANAVCKYGRAIVLWNKTTIQIIIHKYRSIPYQLSTYCKFTEWYHNFLQYVYWGLDSNTHDQTSSLIYHTNEPTFLQNHKMLLYYRTYFLYRDLSKKQDGWRRNQKKIYLIHRQKNSTRNHIRRFLLSTQ